MVKIYGISENLNPIKAELSEIIHYCMGEILGYPQEKRAHRIFPMKKEDYYFPQGRTPAYTVIEINMIQGRKSETLKKLIHMLFNELEKGLGLEPINVEITILEQPPHCWGFRGVTGDEATLNYQIEV